MLHIYISWNWWNIGLRVKCPWLLLLGCIICFDVTIKCTPLWTELHYWQSWDCNPVITLVNAFPYEIAYIPILYFFIYLAWMSQIGCLVIFLYISPILFFNCLDKPWFNMPFSKMSQTGGKASGAVAMLFECNIMSFCYDVSFDISQVTKLDLFTYMVLLLFVLQNPITYMHFDIH